jgi:hypothetical protein
VAVIAAAQRKSDTRPRPRHKTPWPRHDRGHEPARPGSAPEVADDPAEHEDNAEDEGQDLARAGFGPGPTPPREHGGSRFPSRCVHRHGVVQKARGPRRSLGCPAAAAAPPRRRRSWRRRGRPRSTARAARGAAARASGRALRWPGARRSTDSIRKMRSSVSPTLRQPQPLCTPVCG